MEMTLSEALQWGPNLAAYIDEQTRRRWGITANAWVDRTPGITTADLTRWRQGTEPRLEKFRAVAAGLGVPMVTVLARAGVLEQAETDGKVEDPEPPTIDTAIRVDPTLHDDDRDRLQQMVDAFRDIRAGITDEVTIRTDGVKRRRGRR